MSLRAGIFRNDMIPELEHESGQTVQIINERRDGEAYNTPMLMANRAPILSFLFIVAPKIIFHGRNARTVSRMPEYTAGTHR
jgi:hypothetical protein